MTDEIIQESSAVPEPTQEVIAEPATTAPTPVPKKRGRRPKVVLPPPVPAEMPKPVKKRRTPPISSAERAFQSAIASTEKERAKCIEELSKIMEQWDVKQARLKSLDWKISTLKGTTSNSAIAGMQLQSYATHPQPAYPNNAINYPPMPSAYPSPATQYVPPAMRQPAVPIDPRASGGSEGIIDDGQNTDEDQFLTGGGVIGGGRWA